MTTNSDVLTPSSIKFETLINKSFDEEGELKIVDAELVFRKPGERVSASIFLPSNTTPDEEDNAKRERVNERYISN